MDTVFDHLIKMKNPLPPLSGTFWADELKLIKKVYVKARKGKSISSLWNRFEFDTKANVTELSLAYLMKNNIYSTASIDGVQIIEIELVNGGGDAIYLSPLVSAGNASVIDGVMFSDDFNSIKIFNLELNKMLYKFAPDIFRNPSETLNQYLLTLQKESGENLERFNNSNE